MLLRAKGLVSRAMCRVLSGTIIARLARFHIKLHYLNFQ